MRYMRSQRFSHFVWGVIVQSLACTQGYLEEQQQPEFGDAEEEEAEEEEEEEEELPTQATQVISTTAEVSTESLEQEHLAEESGVVPVGAAADESAEPKWCVCKT
jgi:hypothetical protein